MCADQAIGTYFLWLFTNHLLNIAELLTKLDWGKRWTTSLLWMVTLHGCNRVMAYREIPLIIPILAAGYLSIVYLLLMLARRSTAEISRSSQGSRD